MKPIFLRGGTLGGGAPVDQSLCQGQQLLGFCSTRPARAKFTAGVGPTTRGVLNERVDAGRAPIRSFTLRLNGF